MKKSGRISLILKIMLLIPYLFSAMITNLTAAEQSVGIVIESGGGCFKQGLDGVKEQVRKGTRLFPSDTVFKGESELPPEVKWWPYAGWKDSTAGEKWEVTYAPPGSGTKKGMLARLKDFMGFVDTEYEQTHGVSDLPMEIVRSQELFDESFQPNLNDAREAPGASVAHKTSSFSSPPSPCSSKGKPVTSDLRPGYKATLIANVDVKFSDSRVPGGVNTLVITDDQGKEIYSKPHIASKTYKPEELGIQAGKTYYWNIKELGDARKRVIRMIDKELEMQIRNDCRQITNHTSDLMERKLKIAAYLQMVSDIMPDAVDLYWLSRSVLDGIELNQPDHPQLQKFLARWREHLIETEP